MTTRSYLLDTQALLWWAHEPSRLSQPLVGELANADAVVVSHASLWELSITSSIGKLRFDSDVGNWFGRMARVHRWRELAIDRAHVVAAERLPLHHRDPFDRLLIVQAQIERLCLVTGDPAIASYDVDLAW